MRYHRQRLPQAKHLLCLLLLVATQAATQTALAEPLSSQTSPSQTSTLPQGISLKASGQKTSESQARLTGVTRASHDIQLSLPVEGVVASILVQEGQRVTAGESLLQLENSLQEAEAKRREIIKDDNARIKSLEHNLTIVSSLLKSAQDLYGESGSISEEEVKKLDMQHATLLGELQALKMQKKREIVEHEAALEELKRRTLAAPRAGIVSEILVEAGEWATPQQAVVRLVDPSQCYLELHIEERFARSYAAGDSVPVFMPVGSEEQQIEGRVLFVAPIADQASGLVRLKIGFDNHKGEVWPGLSAFIVPAAEARIARNPGAAEVAGAAAEGAVESGVVNGGVVDVR